MSEGKQHVSIVVCGTVDSGKCLKNGTLITTSRGQPKLVETLTLEDSVIGLDGKAKRLVEIHHGNAQLYKISQDNGDDYSVTGSHILVLKFAKDFLANENNHIALRNTIDSLMNKDVDNKYDAKENVLEVSVNDYLELPSDVREALYGFKQEVEFKSKSVEIDPYLLGLWLDGTPIDSENEELIDCLTIFKKIDNNEFANHLEKYDLLENKHIPLDYLMNSRDARLKLLAGILDSSSIYKVTGCWNNTYTINQSSDGLSEDIVKLARSLGFKVKHTRNDAAKLILKLRNVINISGNNISDVPCLLEKNKADASACRKDMESLMTRINVEKDEIGDFTGFQIEGDGRFFGTDYTVLHNSTTTGHLIFELGGIPEREMQKLRDEADRLGKGSFAFAFYMDRQKEERERGVTITVTTKEFFTETKHYTVLDAPGHRSFIKNMITGASQGDCSLVMVPRDGNFCASIARGNVKSGELPGQARPDNMHY